MISFIVNSVLVTLIILLLYKLGGTVNQLEQLKRDHADDIKLNRKQAVDASRAVLKGKISEHMIPHMPEFTYNAADARFMGSPIDYVIFDGMSDGDIQNVIIVDIKTGKSRLNKNQRQIRDAIKAGKVEFKTIAL